MTSLGVSVAAIAGEAPSADAIENELRACLLNTQRSSTCIQTTLASYLPPNNEDTKRVAKDLDGYVKKWLASEKVFALHKIKTTKSGELFERRSFLLEDTSGSFAVVQFSTIRQLGKLYVLDFKFNSTRAQVDQLLFQKEGACPNE